MTYLGIGNNARGVADGRSAVVMAFVAAIVVALTAVAFTARADAHVEGVGGSAKIKLSTSKGAGKKLKKSKVSIAPKSASLDIREIGEGESGSNFVTKSSNIKFTSKTKKNGKVKKRTAKLKVVGLNIGEGDTVYDVELNGKLIAGGFTSSQTSVDWLQTNLYGFALDNGVLRLSNGLAKKLAKRLKLKSSKVKPGVIGTANANLSARFGIEADSNPYHSVCAMDATGSMAGALGAAPTPSDYPEFDSAQALADLEAQPEQSVSWGWRASFLSYVHFSGGSFSASNGAVISQANPALAPTNFSFPAEGGSYEAGSNENNTDAGLVVESSGDIVLCNNPHGFAISFRNPVVVLDGDDSVLKIDVASYVDGTWSEFRTVDFADLDPTSSEGVYTDSGHVIHYSDIAATLSADGEDVMGGLGGAFEAYVEGYALAPVSAAVEIVQRPFEDACVPASFGASPVDINEINFSRAEWPTLTDPASLSEASFDWGFRRSTRSSVQNGGASNPAGAFPRFGGVTESHPGNMGGTAANPLPAGGIGKFFTFPSSVEWEAGEELEDIGRLIVSSEGTLTFCNLNFGSYNLIISKPTVIIDGADSRIVANAYAARHAGGVFNWQGGLVDLVKLDISGATVTDDSGVRTISGIRVLVDGDPAVGLRTDALTLGTLTPAGTGATTTPPEEPNGWDPISISYEIPN